MGAILNLVDRLQNALTGQGTGRDVRSAATYAAIAPLTQHSIEAAYRGSGLLRKIVQIPALDMVREWREWEGLDSDQSAKLWDEEKRLGLREKAKLAETLRGLGGGAFILGLPGDPAQPAPQTTGLGQLAYINVVSRWHLQFDRLEDDARLPGFGEPAMWRMSTAGGMTQIHPSRVVAFRADTSATLISTTIDQAEAFWGESRLSQVLDAVKDSDSARAAFAALLHKARLLRIGIPGLMDLVSTQDGERNVMQRLAILAQAESIHNATIYDAGEGPDSPGEKLDDVTYSFAGAKDVLNAYAEFVAAISDIPATRLLGRAPEGMNSSGDSQQKDWAKKVRAMQTLDLGPCLDRVDAFLLPSALGKTEPDASYAFPPLDVETDKERADRFFVQMQAAEKLAGMAALPEEVFNRGLQSLVIAEGYLPELEAALADIPDEERYGISPDTETGANDPTKPVAAKGGDPASAGEGAAGTEPVPPRRAANDAAPRSLYVQRKLLNAEELIAWAKAQGFETTLPADELHVTVAYSRQALDWMKVESSWDGEDGTLTVPPGGARLVEPLGDKGAIVLLFNSSTLSWRHRQIINAGGSHDFEDYQPHVTISYAKPEGLDLASVEPFRGALRFGPEIFSEIKAHWAANQLAEET